ncbi:MAG TPA: 50S ribosomal protein L25 [Thermoleophilia bacterium]
MDTIKLAVRTREETGNGPSRRFRAAGQVPAVAYGKGHEATPIVIAIDDLRAALAHGHNVVLELEFEAAKKAAKSTSKAKRPPLYAVVKEIQFHPTKRSFVHVDLHEVDLAVEIEATVAIELVGTAAGLADLGMLDWLQREVNVRALPNSVPDSLSVDVSHLLIGHHVAVKDLTAPPGVVILDDPETVIASVLPPRVEVEEVAPQVAEAPVEPEVIGGVKSEE